MYSICSSKVREEFLRTELSKDHYEFSQEMDWVYSSIYDFLQSTPGLHDFDKRGAPEDLNNGKNVLKDKINTAREITYLLSAHTLKNYHVFMKFEEKNKASKQPLLLDNPSVVILDNGCGGGSASIALIQLFANYQKFRIENNHPITTITIHVLGIDPNLFALEIFTHFMKESETRLCSLLINIKCEVFPGTLSENLGFCLDWIARIGSIGTCILSFSNIIRPLASSFNQRKKALEDTDDLLKSFLPKFYCKVIGDQEITSIRNIFKSENINTIVLPVISSRSGGANDSKNWFDALWRSILERLSIIKKLERIIKPRRGKDKRHRKNKWVVETTSLVTEITRCLKSDGHTVIKDQINRTKISMIGPSKCYFRFRLEDNHLKEIPFVYSYILATNKFFKKDRLWEQVLENKNLMLAWARVRNSASFELYEDTLAMRLFELNIDERLEKLKRSALSYQWDFINTTQMLNYLVPKGQGKAPRPMSLCGIEEQILTTAILQTRQKEYASKRPRSFSYKISTKNNTENLFDNWLISYKEYKEGAIEFSKCHRAYQVIQTDISSFYTDIQQDLLHEEVCNQLRLDHSRTKDFLFQLISRDCNTGKKGKGIPQGHIASGVFANIYLTPIDELFGSNNKWKIEYFRYVDDMILIVPPSVSSQSILDLLDQGFLSIHLKRNLEKTKIMTVDEFLEITASNFMISDISKRFNFLLSDLYKLNKENLQILQSNWWNFVYSYQKLLRSIGIFINPSRLSRKVKKNLDWWNKPFWSWSKLKLPAVSSEYDLLEIEKWRMEFIRMNGNGVNCWMEKRLKIKQDLYSVYKESLASIQNPQSDVDMAKARSNLKFTLNRLGKLGFEDVINTLPDIIISSPWLINIRRVCEDMALQDLSTELVSIYIKLDEIRQDEKVILSANILRSFRFLPNMTEDVLLILRKVMKEYDYPCKQAMALETLFITNQASCLSKAEIISLMRMKNHSIVQKNLALVYNLASSNGIRENLQPEIRNLEIVNEAIEFNRLSQPLNLSLAYEEPDIISHKFYDKNYPDDDSEFPQIPSWVN